MTRASVRILVSAAVVASLPACVGAREAPLTADLPLHLEDHLDAAVVTGSKAPANPPSAVEWRFDQPQPDWKPAQPLNPGSVPARMAWVNGALRVTATDRGDRQPNGVLNPLIYIDLPDWRREDWLEVVVRARTTSMTQMAVGLGTWEGEVAPAATRRTLRGGGSTPVVSDGTVQTYRIRPDWGGQGAVGSWRRLGLGFFTREPGSIDLLSVSVVPIGALYAANGVSVQNVQAGYLLRRTLVTHAPGRIAYRVRVPQGGRIDAALGLLDDNSPVEFRVVGELEDGVATTLFTETLADREGWTERSVDLSRFAGQTITLALEAASDRPGTVAFWGAPTLSGVRRTDKPNVILYIIDGGWADDMSVYGYNRRTTPYLERLAAEGAVFEHAYSNASWTLPSTASFMTSLQMSVLGGSGSGGLRVPPQARTMAEHMYRAGYQTAVFASNPNAGRLSNLDRGVEVLRDSFVERDYTSSVELHAAYWGWRDAFPGEPYWVHFQTTDVHASRGGRLTSVAPFSGTYVSAGRRREFLGEWDLFNQRRGGPGPVENYAFARGLEEAGVDRVGFFETLRGLYDESMAHQDYQLGRLVERLRDRGEWENTLLVVASDHGAESAVSDLGALLQDSLPPRWTRSMVRGSITRVPLIFVWPGHIEGGRRFDNPVSMIDVLPTLLDLTGLPLPDVSQGQSLAPLLRDEPGWTRRPVVMDMVSVDPATGDMQGLLDVIDGRWGASMQMGPPPNDPALRRPWPVLVFDVWADPWALAPINEQRPDLVQKYTRFLEDQLHVHRTLAKQFTPGAKPALTPDQLERLRALGYIR